MRPTLIAIEGLDGSGKATQTARLEAVLQSRGMAVRRVTFPDYAEPSSALVKMYLDGTFGTDPGDVNAYAASTFYAVDRYASFRRFWQTDYEQGTVILADRYTTSNAIYQMAKLPRAQWQAFLIWLADLEHDKMGLPRPRRTIYLDMPPEISQRLLTGRYHGDESQKDIHESHLTYLRSCRNAALYAAVDRQRVLDLMRRGMPRSIGRGAGFRAQPGTRRARWTTSRRMCAALPWRC